MPSCGRATSMLTGRNHGLPAEPDRVFVPIQLQSVLCSSRAGPLREGGGYPRVNATNSSPDFLPPLPMSRPPPPAAMTTYCLPSTP